MYKIRITLFKKIYINIKSSNFSSKKVLPLKLDVLDCGKSWNLCKMCVKNEFCISVLSLDNSQIYVKLGHLIDLGVHKFI